MICLFFSSRRSITPAAIFSSVSIWQPSFFRLVALALAIAHNVHTKHRIIYTLTSSLSQRNSQAGRHGISTRLRVCTSSRRIQSIDRSSDTRTRKRFLLSKHLRNTSLAPLSILTLFYASFTLCTRSPITDERSSEKNKHSCMHTCSL